ncbi:ABC transporter ATP-binding protein [Pimelobacter simplex]|uniref:ABC-type quaternary amine transporter n=1 Tax=Nocardioides simplex TaxID=2045 RepID=A0A0A1DNQ2_NOCSI|nr:ATP-binding cassette domain-containing protein [Pimelobacter simplex]AIY16990.1 L-proline glycine betaine ABC transport system permease protein ProV [Pimelobacter simplex]MCG8152160.1 ATP-binding cassette domain-containing protein [Pimelobacter simplex]GEB12908.1 ABC transporter ATP-binding protein [Pimelobacter simplex]SFM52433.1 osmoprotectant transport system ATP-binding protein [Pimelobacter simplex]
MGIEFRDVGKTYPDGTVAVTGFSCSIPSHRTLALVGTSGSGKTTLMRMVNRMVEPTTGTVLIDDRDVHELEKVALRRSIGYVPQAGGLLPHRRVVDNVATVPVLTGTTRRAARTAALQLLELVGLDPALGKRYPAQLSGGQQQRVAVARALAADPNVLLMDEPFGAVDPIVRRDLQDQLVQLQAELGKTIVLVTHDIDEAFKLGDQVVILRTGGIVAQTGTPQEILAAPADDFVRDFVGIGRAERSLQTVDVDGRNIVVDGSGRPVGVLT